MLAGDDVQSLYNFDPLNSSPEYAGVATINAAQAIATYRILIVAVPLSITAYRAQAP